MQSSARTGTALTMALACVGSSVAFAQGTFPGRVWPLGAGLEARALATADFNRDGRPDLAACSFVGKQLGVLRSEGLGLFAPFAGQQLNSNPVALCAGDFSGDGIPDLVFSAPLSIALGNPDGTLGLATSLGSGVAARSIAAQDFDLDGKLDLAIGDQSNSRVVLLRGLGAGTFGPPISYPLPGGAAPWEIAIGDITGDGILDLVAGYAVQNAGGIAWIPGLGGFGFGTWQSIATGSVGSGLDLGDLDGDGDLDVALAAWDREAVLFNANGTLGAPITLNAAYTLDVDAEDLNGDGKHDLIFATPGAGGVRVYLALAGGGFSAPQDYVSGGPLQTVLAMDVDGDGAIDVAVGCNAGVLILLGDGNGALSSARRIGTSGIWGMAVGDMDGDGIDDLITAPVFGSAVDIRLGDGAGGFGSAMTFPTLPWATRLAVGRIDSNATLDVVVAHNTNKLSILLGDGVGGLSAPLAVASTTAPSSLAIADLNGDGKSDVAVTAGGDAHTQGWGVGVHFGNGAGGMSAPSLTVTGLTPESLSAGDLDGDGDIDLACGNSVGWDCFVLWNDGSGQLTVQSIPIGHTSQPLQITDFDVDGHADLIVGGPTSLDVLRGLGAGAFALPSSHAAEFMSNLSVADFDGDGRLDVAGASGPGIDLYSGDGASGFTSVRGFVASSNVYEMATLDADRDGRLDLLSSNSGLTLLHRNQGEAIGPAVYCTAKTNSLGCIPAIGWTGASSASASTGFDLNASQVRNKKAGLLMYGITGRAAVPFSGGVLCVRAPIKRTPVMNSGGSQSGNDCSGVYALEMNAFASGALGGNPSPELRQPGVAVTAQFWGRDPGFPAPDSTTLSDAIEYVVGV